MTTPPRRRAPAVSAGWAASNPVDDDPPTPPAAARRKTTPAPRAPGRTTMVHTDDRAPAARADLTGKPRVDWAAYDAQIYDTAPEWVLYRCWTRVPLDRRWYVRVLARMLILITGRVHSLLWIGISMRAGIARATEHLADKGWRRLIHVFEIDPDAGDAGLPGARYFTTERAAELYENARIAAECPRFNTAGNERAYNPGATHLTKRIKSRHLADWHRQAGLLAMAWLAAAAGCTWLLWPADVQGVTGAVSAVVTGIGAAAALLMFGRILRLAIKGAQPTSAQRARIIHGRR